MTSPSSHRLTHDLALFAALARAEHPALHDLRGVPEVQPILDDLPMLACVLLGSGPPKESWMYQLLEMYAPDDLELLTFVSHKKPLQASSVAISLAQHIARLLRAAQREKRKKKTPTPQASAPPLNTPSSSTSSQVPRQDDANSPQHSPPAGTPQTLTDLLRVSNPSKPLKTSAMTHSAVQSADRTERLQRTLESLMPGTASSWGHARSSLAATLLQQLETQADLLAHLQSLEEIARHLGRMESAMRTREESQRRGREDVVGVRMSAELADVLPSEWALLSDRASEDLFYQRYTESRLLTLELEGVSRVHDNDEDERGPVIACVDTSGSMMGTPELIAKACILAVARRVLPQGRTVRLMLFGGVGDIEDVELRPGASSARALLDFLCMSFHAGTDFDGPLLRALHLLEENTLRQADILIVTDGLCSAAPDVVQRLEATRERNPFRVVSIVVGDHIEGVEPFSDDVWRFPLDTNSNVEHSAGRSAPDTLM